LLKRHGHAFASFPRKELGASQDESDYSGNLWV
jgi:hypothetical protein